MARAIRANELLPHRLTCTYAHRMQSPRGHAPISDVLAAAGIDVPVPMGTATANPPASQATPPPSSLSSSSALPFPSPHSSPLSSPSKPSQQQKQRLENSPVQPITGSRALAHAKSSSTSMSFGQYMATLWTKRNLVAPSPSLPLGSAVSASPTRPYKSRLPAHQPSSTAVNSGSFNAKNNNKPVESLSRSKGNKLKKRSASMGTHPLMSPAPGLGACVDHVPVRRGAGGAGAGADVGRKVGHRGVFGVWYGDRGSASFDLPPLTQGRERAATMPFLCHLNSDVTRTRSLDLQRPSPPSHGICAPRGQRNDGDEDEGDVTDEEDEEEWVRARAEEMEAMMEKKRIRREKGHREGGGTGPRSGSASASAPSPVPVGIGREPESVREGEAEVMIIGFGNDVGVESG
ncbi:hypothetical protein H0H92_009322 [Tricholoma furcatifolium]|nr:hypothetical protein H0H92_009322 [Tricholoma furcatifolium]